jgi:GNAT superfamily N-acetyltransferase
MGGHARRLYEEEFSIRAGTDRILAALGALGSSESEVYPADPEHVDQIVRVHLAAFPGFFLSTLGPSFLRLFYRELQADPAALLLVSLRKGRVTGVVGGVVDESEFFRSLRQRRQGAFIRASLRTLMRRPATARPLWRARRRHAQHQDGVPATLLTLAVDPGEQGHGTGRALVKAFTEDLIERNIDSYKLTTDALDNDATIQFYLSQRFQITDHWSTPEGRQMLTLVLPPSS